MRRILLKQRRRPRRPNVMISGSEKQRESPVGYEDLLELPPFGFRGGVIQTLDRVADAKHERRIFGGGFLPNALIDAGLGFPRSVA